MSGGRRGEGFTLSNNILVFIFEHSIATQDPEYLQGREYLILSGKKLALRFIAHKYVVGQPPPHVHPCPHHMISVSSPSLFFDTLLLSLWHSLFTVNSCLINPN